MSVALRSHGRHRAKPTGATRRLRAAMRVGAGPRHEDPIASDDLTRAATPGARLGTDPRSDNARHDGERVPPRGRRRWMVALPHAVALSRRRRTHGLVPAAPICLVAGDVLAGPDRPAHRMARSFLPIRVPLGPTHPLVRRSSRPRSRWSWPARPGTAPSILRGVSASPSTRSRTRPAASRRPTPSSGSASRQTCEPSLARCRWSAAMSAPTVGPGVVSTPRRALNPRRYLRARPRLRRNTPSGERGSRLQGRHHGPASPTGATGRPRAAMTGRVASVLESAVPRSPSDRLHRCPESGASSERYSQPWGRSRVDDPERLEDDLGVRARGGEDDRG